MVKASLFVAAVASSIIISIIIPTCCGLEAQLKKYVFNNNGLGTYSFEYETQDGTYRREDGGFVNGPDGSLVVRGEYGYIDPSGRPFALRYIADANGFQPVLDDDTRFNDRRIL
ncbi:endocuticle structural glycoprotein ABD-5-like isoform X2 [Cydia pomonella]|uniref:endocuticle structural glycoprotein ABD-5-like isoform X2 n=1 Tax=Cydia pomonella TaxID=82600 RepID=UPI002ADE8089|nr:endocuticle structural glycoprotein ABD-5-like isoform X2 [Cydia pomonella]